MIRFESTNWNKDAVHVKCHYTVKLGSPSNGAVFVHQVGFEGAEAQGAVRQAGPRFAVYVA